MTTKNRKFKKIKIVDKAFHWLKSRDFPCYLIDIFQYYLIADKVFGLNFFGELSWWQVFIPLWITISIMLFTGYDNNEEHE